MGLTDGVYFVSWFLEYIVLNTIFAIINSIFMSTMVFNYVGFGWIFMLFWLYGISIVSLAYFFTSFMDKTRIALILSILVYFVMFFVSLVADNEEVGNSIKMLASVLPPTCMELGISIFQKFDVI